MFPSVRHETNVALEIPMLYRKRNTLSPYINDGFKGYLILDVIVIICHCSSLHWYYFRRL